LPVKREQLWFLNDVPAAHDLGLWPLMTALRAMTGLTSFRHQNTPQRRPGKRRQLSIQ
jgi:hypothetical protein